MPLCLNLHNFVYFLTYLFIHCLSTEVVNIVILSDTDVDRQRPLQLFVYRAIRVVERQPTSVDSRSVDQSRSSTDCRRRCRRCGRLSTTTTSQDVDH